MKADYFRDNIDLFVEAIERLETGRSDSTFSALVNSSDEESPEQFCELHDFEIDSGLEEEYETESSGKKQPRAIALYFREAQRYPLLTREQETELAKRIAQGDEDARMRLINSNLRLVGHVAKRYLYPNVEYDDLIQEGNIGLIKAVDKYEYTKGFKFATYAFWWIRREIMNYISSQGYTISLPAKGQSDLSAIKRAIDRYMAEHNGERPKIEEIAAMVKMLPARIMDLVHATVIPVSMEEPAKDRDDALVEEHIADENAVSPQELIEQGELEKLLGEALKELPTKERRIVELHYGVADGVPRSYEDIAKEFNISRQRVHFLDTRAKRKLLDSDWGQRLEEYLPMAL